MATSEYERGRAAGRAEAAAALAAEARDLGSSHSARSTIERVRRRLGIVEVPEVQVTARWEGEALILPRDAPARALREAAGLTCRGVSTALACSHALASAIEKRGGAVSLDTLTRYAGACGWEVEHVARRPR